MGGGETVTILAPEGSKKKENSNGTGLRSLGYEEKLFFY